MAISRKKPSTNEGRYNAFETAQQKQGNSATDHTILRTATATDLGTTGTAYMGTTPPSTVNTTSQRITSKKAIFTIQASPEDVGKRIYIYTRWTNNSDASKTGLWSQMGSVTVTD